MYTEPLALANGRFPKADVIATVPGGDGSRLFMRSTFGLLLSNDGGKTWTWLCEQALGFSGTWDPPIVVTRDGRLWAGLADGLRVTKNGCDVREVPELKGELIADLSADARGDRGILVTSTPDKAANVWRQTGADRWEKLGKGISGFAFDTLDAAPSRPARVYLTGVPTAGGLRAHLFRSDDGGATLTEVKIAVSPSPNDGRLFLSAIDPKNPDRLLVRHVNAQGSNLLLSTDGGETFTVALTMKASMFGFAKSTDGATYWAGSGDPKEGIWRSVDRGVKWEQVSKASVLCLHADGPRLFSCSNPYALGGYAIAVSTDGGGSLRALATFDDVTGAVACDAGAGTTCSAAWADVKLAIASSGRSPAVAPRDAGSARSTVPDASPSRPEDAESPATPRARCGCQTGGLRASWPSMATVAALGLRRWGRARRRARRAGV